MSLEKNDISVESLVKSIDNILNQFDDNDTDSESIKIYQSEKIEQEKKKEEKVQMYCKFSEVDLKKMISEIEEKRYNIEGQIRTLKTQLYNKISKSINMCYLMSKKIISYGDGVIGRHGLTVDDINLFQQYVDKTDYWSIWNSFVDSIINNIKLPVTKEKILQCKDNMINYYLFNSFSNCDKIKEMWIDYEKLNVEEFKIKINNKIDELNKLSDELTKLGNNIHTKYSNYFDLVSLFYEDISWRKSEYLIKYLNFNDEDLGILEKIKEKRDIYHNLIEDVICMDEALSSKTSLDDIEKDLNNMIDNIQIDNVYIPELEGKSFEEKKIIKEQWLSDMESHNDIEQYQDDIKKEIFQNNYINNN